MEKGLYLIERNDNLRLNEFGFTQGTPILLQMELNGVFVFDVRGSRIGIRREDLDTMNLIKLQNIENFDP
jgi:Fe2+ transport system protein FeoA